MPVPLGEVQSSPAIGDGIVYFGARDGALYAVDAAKGALRWKADQENFSWVISGPALYKGMVIVGTSDAQDIKAYDAKTGQRKWKAASPEPANILASPTICGDTLYIGDFYGSMLWLNSPTGKLLGGSNSPASRTRFTPCALRRGIDTQGLSRSSLVLRVSSTRAATRDDSKINGNVHRSRYDR